MTKLKKSSARNNSSKIKKFYNEINKLILNRNFVESLALISNFYDFNDLDENYLNKILLLELTCYNKLYLVNQQADKLNGFDDILGLNENQSIKRLFRLSLNRLKLNDNVELPSNILLLLLLSSINLGQVDLAKFEVENWLFSEHNYNDLIGYNKVKQFYIIDILPLLGEWDVARDLINNSGFIDKEKSKLSDNLNKLFDQFNQKYYQSNEQSNHQVNHQNPLSSPSTPFLSPSLSQSLSSSSSDSTYTATPSRLKKSNQINNNIQTNFNSANTSPTIKQHLDVKSRISDHTSQPSSLEPSTNLSNHNNNISKVDKFYQILGKLRYILPRVLPPFLFFIIALILTRKRNNSINIRDKLARQDSASHRLWNKLIQTIQMGTRGMLP